jgi:hypothetical protein
MEESNQKHATSYFRDAKFSPVGTMMMGHWDKGINLGSIHNNCGALTVELDGNWQPQLPAAVFSTLATNDPQEPNLDRIIDVMAALHTIDEKSDNKAHFASTINTLYKGALEYPARNKEAWVSHCVNCALQPAERADADLLEAANSIAAHFIDAA